MPRKRSDPAAEVLSYFMDTPYEVALLMLNLVKGQMAKRAPAVEKKPVVRRRRKPSTPAEMVALAERQLATPNTPPAPRKRRMRAGSQPPVNEATPIVPAMETGS